MQLDQPDPNTEDPGDLSLRDWLKRHPHPSLTWMHAFIGVVGGMIHDLHERRLGYFRLSPDTVIVCGGSSGSPIFRLDAPERAIAIEARDLIPIPVDPWYAPPEAAGLSRHAPGPLLLAWDWWSLGRIVQEILLGKPVLWHLAGKEIPRDSAEACERAEALLLSKHTGTLHPGAVEQMPAGNPRFELLLKGLLSASPMARWARPQVENWLSGGSPKEHYAMSRHERLFRLHGQNYTVAEAAELLSTEEHWNEAGEHLLQPEKPHTLAAFLREEIGQSAALHRLEEVVGLLQDETYRDLPPKSVEEAVVILGLQQLTGGKLIRKGRRMDVSSLRSILKEERGSGAGLGTVASLAAAPSIALMDHFDTETARILSDTHKWVEKIAAHAAKLGWMSRNDTAGITRLWILALETPATLHRIIEDMHAAYAMSTRPEAEHLFRIAQPAIDEAILLAWLAPVAPRFGFISHEAWAKQRAEELRRQGQRVVADLYWRYLQRALKSGPWWFGHMSWLVAGWGAALVTVTIASPGPVMLGLALLPVLLAFGMRFGMGARIDHHLRIMEINARRWHFLDGPSRCKRELEASDLVLRTTEELRHMLEDINRELTSLRQLEPPPSPVSSPPRLRLVWWSSIASWILLFLIFGLCFRELRLHPPTWDRFREAWTFGESTEGNDSHGSTSVTHSTSKPILLPWPFTTPQEARSVSPKAVVDATQEQMRMAIEIGNRLTKEYNRSSIDALIAVQIPSDTTIAFMLYDARKKQVVNKTAFILHYVPLPRTWIDLGGKKAIVLAD